MSRAREEEKQIVMEEGNKGKEKDGVREWREEKGRRGRSRRDRDRSRMRVCEK